MLIPEVTQALQSNDRLNVIVGIEVCMLPSLQRCHDRIFMNQKSHICVLQTALDLRKHGKEVVVLADGVSSCNPEDVPIALATIRQAGGLVLTSESFLFMNIGKLQVTDSSPAHFSPPRPVCARKLKRGKSNPLLEPPHQCKSNTGKKCSFCISI